MNTCFCDGGLANRLNALLFCLILRQRYGHVWEVSWQRNNWCGAAFSSLFDIDLPVVEHTLATFKQREADYWFLVHENQGNFDPARIVYHRDLTGYEAYRQQLEQHPNLFYTHNLIPDFVTLGEIQTVLPGLRVKPHLLAQVLTFCRERKIDHTVFGLHIRKTDFGDTVNDGELYRLVAQNPNRFFVCSDDAEVTRRFGALPNCEVLEKQHYPEKLTTDGSWNAWTVDNEGRHFPFNITRSEAAIVEGLLDLLILSKTTPMAASHSTFFAMAMIFNRLGYLAGQGEILEN